MKRFTRIIATLLLGVMLMTTLTGCNRYYYYYYINSVLGGSGSSSSLPTNGNLFGSSSDSSIEDYDVVLHQLVMCSTWNQASSVTDGNPSNFTKAWARLMETVIPHHAFSTVLELENTTEKWQNKHYQSVTVVASEKYDKMAEACGLAWNGTVNGSVPCVDGYVQDTAKQMISEYGDKYAIYFVTIINQPLRQKPVSPGGESDPGNFYNYWTPLGDNMIGISTDSNPNTFDTFSKYGANYSDQIVTYTLGTYRINENYIALIISAS